MHCLFYYSSAGILFAFPVQKVPCSKRFLFIGDRQIPVWSNGFTDIVPVLSAPKGRDLTIAVKR